MPEQLVICSLGKENYGLPVSQVKEIIRDCPSIKIPNTPHFMEGIINIRGQIIPIIDLTKRFGFNMTAIAERKIVIIDNLGQDFGMVVDNVTEVLWIDEGAIEPVPSFNGEQRGFIRGVGKIDQRLVIILDAAKLLENDETALLRARPN